MNTFMGLAFDKTKKCQDILKIYSIVGSWYGQFSWSGPKIKSDCSTNCNAIAIAIAMQLQRLSGNKLAPPRDGCKLCA